MSATAQADEAGVPACGLPCLRGEAVGPGEPVVRAVRLVERLALAQGRFHAVTCEAEELGGAGSAADGVGKETDAVGLRSFGKAGKPGICQGGCAALVCGVQAGLRRGAVPGAEPRPAGVDAARMALAEGLKLLEREGGALLVLSVRAGEGDARGGVCHVRLAGKHHHLVDVLDAVEALGRHRGESSACKGGGKEVARDAPGGVRLGISGAKAQLNVAVLEACAVAGRCGVDACAKAEHVAARFAHAPDELLEHGGLEQLVGAVEEEQVVAACALDACHAAQVDALAMGLLEHLKAGVALGGSLGNVGRAVFGGVVHHDCLEVAEGLRRQAGDAAGQLVGDVARGDHNRDSGHGTDPSSKPQRACLTCIS